MNGFKRMRRSGSFRRTSWVAVLGAALVGLTLAPRAAAAQGAQETAVIDLAAGNSWVIQHPVTLQRVSIADPRVADAVVVSAREIVVNGKEPGSTSVVLWDNAGGRAMYRVRVSVDAASLQEDLRSLFPEDELEVRASGNTLVLGGTVREAANAKRALEVAQNSVGEDITVIDNFAVPEPDQVLVQIRFAEVSRTAMKDLSSNLLVAESENFALATGAQNNVETSDEDDAIAEVFSDAVNIFLFHRPSGVAAFLRALKSNGLFKSLAEPNLLALDGDSASFLAGGEFPFPVLQGTTNAVTIQFKEFGVRLSFRPTITPSGAIRLEVAPEVSSLDFANGLEISGFRVPALLSRKARTTIELDDGQTFAIAGLLDNSLTQNVQKVPILGDIPVLGALFRSEEMRQNRSELLVLVTPRLVRPEDRRPPVPTGEAETWKWQRPLQGPPPGSPRAEAAPAAEAAPETAAQR